MKYSMLDLEFLGAPPPFEGPLIYRYRSGLLRRRMIAVLQDIANQEGLMLVEKGREVSLLGLFASFPVFEWPASRSRKPTVKELATLSEAIEQGGRSAFFISNHVQLDENPIWQKVRKKSLTLVAEELVTIETLAPTLRFFEATTDLPIAAGSSLKLGLLEHFEEIASGQGELLSTMLNRFDELMLAAMDAEGGGIPAKAPGHIASAQSSRLRSLRTVLVSRDMADIPFLISSFANYYWRDRRSRLDVVRELYRLTEALLSERALQKARTGTPFPGQGDVVDEQVLALWAAMLLAWEERLISEQVDAALSYRRTPDLELTYIDSFLREFLRFTGNLNAGAELRHVLRGLAAALPLDLNSSDPIHTSRERMLTELKVLLSRRFVQKYPWWRAFEFWVTNALVKESEAPDAAPLKQETGQQSTAQSGIDMTSTTFGEMIGRQGAIAGLRRRARDRRKTTGMILYGPPGIGKRTMGRILSKALLCEAVTPDGDSCGHCDQCKAFSTRGSAGYIEIATGALNVDTARDIASRVRQVSIVERCVVVIADVDRADPAAIDALLKSIEDDEERTIFVLTASKLKDVRMALQSRCEKRRIHALNRDESLSYLQQRGEKWGPEIFNLVEALGRGVPGTLNELSAAVSTAENVTFASAVRSLGLSSTSDIAEAMSHLSLSATDTTSQDRLPLCRYLLTELYLLENKVAPYGNGDLAALRHLSSAEFADCKDFFESAARAAGMTNRQFWQKVAAECV